MDTLANIKNPAKRWHLIKALLALRGISLSELGQRIGVTRQAVCNASKRPYPFVERAIANSLDMQPQTIWPERYDHNGNPVRQRPNAPYIKPDVRKFNYSSDKENVA